MAVWGLVGSDVMPLDSARRQDRWSGFVIRRIPADWSRRRSLVDGVWLGDAAWVDPDRPRARRDPMGRVLSLLAGVWDPEEVAERVTVAEIADAVCARAGYAATKPVRRAIAESFDTPLGVALGAETAAFAAAAAPLLSPDALARLIRACATQESAYAPTPPRRLEPVLAEAVGHLPPRRREQLLGWLFDAAHPRGGGRPAVTPLTQWRNLGHWRVSDERAAVAYALPDSWVRAWVGIDAAGRTEWLGTVSRGHIQWLIDMLGRAAGHGQGPPGLDDVDRLQDRDILNGLVAGSAEVFRREAPNSFYNSWLCPGEFQHRWLNPKARDLQMLLQRGFRVCSDGASGNHGHHDRRVAASLAKLLLRLPRAERDRMAQSYPSVATLAYAAVGRVDRRVLEHPRIDPVAAVIGARLLDRGELHRLVLGHPNPDVGTAICDATPRRNRDGSAFLERDVLETVVERYEPDDLRRHVAAVVAACHLHPDDPEGFRLAWIRRTRTAVQSLRATRHTRWGRIDVDSVGVAVEEQHHTGIPFRLPATGWKLDDALDDADPAVRIEFWRAGLLPTEHLRVFDIDHPDLRAMELAALGASRNGPRSLLARRVDTPPATRPPSDLFRLATLATLGPVDPQRVKKATDWLDLVKDADPFHLPDELAPLDGLVLDPDEGWTIRLITSTAALFANAEWMGNCTYQLYLDDMHKGTEIIIVVHARRTRWNASLLRRGPRWTLGEVNSRFNTGEVPELLLRRLGAVVDRLNDGTLDDPFGPAITPWVERFDSDPPQQPSVPFHTRARARATRHRRPQQ